MVYLYLGIGGVVGTIARYVLGTWVQARIGHDFPWGTLMVNLSGSLLLGFLARLLDAAAASQETRVLLAAGFCGAFTTFSTLGLETLLLIQDGSWGRAAGYALGSVILGVAAVALGFALAGPLLRSAA